jgi:peroxiredoxin family protein
MYLVSVLIPPDPSVVQPRSERSAVRRWRSFGGCASFLCKEALQRCFFLRGPQVTIIKLSGVKRPIRSSKSTNPLMGSWLARCHHFSSKKVVFLFISSVSLSVLSVRSFASPPLLFWNLRLASRTDNNLFHCHHISSFKMSNEDDATPMEICPKIGTIVAAPLPAKEGDRAGAESDSSKGLAQLHDLQCSMDEEVVEDKSLMPPPSMVDAQKDNARQSASAPIIGKAGVSSEVVETKHPQLQPSPSEVVPIVLEEGAITLTDEEKLLFSALEAAAQFHFETHETAEFSPSPSESEASSVTASRVGSTVDLKAHKEKEELQDKMMKSVIAMEGEAQQQTKNKKRRRVNIRVAGGWVRDKLLGLESDDIDVALDEASGVQFAHMLRDYLEYVEEQVKLHSALTQEMSEKVNKDGSSNDIVNCDHCSPIKHIPSDIHRHHRHHKHKYKIGVIAANPNQSKHLETATMKIFGLQVDVRKTSSCCCACFVSCRTFLHSYFFASYLYY